MSDPRTELVGRGYDAIGEHFADYAGAPKTQRLAALKVSPAPIDSGYRFEPLWTVEQAAATYRPPD